MFVGVAAGLLVASRLVWLRRTFYESGFHGDGLVARTARRRRA